MPTYEYSCESCSHVHSQIRGMAERNRPATCPVCRSSATLIMSAPHVPTDGVYSYAPNIGSPEAFERKQEAIKNSRGMRGWDERVKREDQET